MQNYYHEQSWNNMVALYEEQSYSERRETFLKIAERLNGENVGWAVGCSMNLFFRGIVDDFHDLDLIVKIEDIKRIADIMESIGAKLVETGGNGFCESDAYCHFQLGRVDIDVISGFRMNTFGTTYRYQYCSSECDTVDVQNLKVPLVPLEAMYVLYYMMEGWQPKRRFKRQLIEEYFSVNQEVKHQEVLRKAMAEFELPGQIRWAVRKLLNDWCQKK